MDWLKELKVGLSRALRYLYPPILILCLIMLINPKYSDPKITDLSWALILLSVVIGAGLYATHRALVIPFHYLSLIFLLWLWDMLRKETRLDSKASTSPTRWLGSNAFNVPRCRRMLAYLALRRNKKLLSESEQDALNIAHAENGLIVMSAVGIFGAAAFVRFNPCFPANIGPLPLLIAGIAFWIASYIMAVEQHKLECLDWRQKEARYGTVTIALIESGMIPDPKLKVD